RATGPDEIAITVTDPAGEPVLDVAALRVRPADFGTLTGRTRLGRDWLFEVGWTPAPVLAPVEEWTFHRDLGDGPLPQVVVHTPGEDDGPMPERAHRATRQALNLLRDWLADPARSAARLVFATALDDPAAEAVRGLVRSAQSEHPGRFGILALDRIDAATVELGLRAGADEPEVA